MILIEIKNAKELVKQEKGLLASKIGPLLTDVETAVENLIIEEIKASFARKGVEANILSVRGITLHHSADGQKGV